MEIVFDALNGKKIQAIVSRDSNGGLYAAVYKEGLSEPIGGKLSEKNFKELCFDQEFIWDVVGLAKENDGKFWITLVMTKNSEYD